MIIVEEEIKIEQMLLENGSDQKSLYGFNIYFDGEIEYDSMINPPRNREAGFPRVGRDVVDPVAREKNKGASWKMDKDLRTTWFEMPVSMQISNIGS